MPPTRLVGPAIPMLSEDGSTVYNSFRHAFGANRRYTSTFGSRAPAHTGCPGTLYSPCCISCIFRGGGSGVFYVHPKYLVVVRPLISYHAVIALAPEGSRQYECGGQHSLPTLSLSPCLIFFTLLLINPLSCYFQNSGTPLVRESGHNC